MSNEAALHLLINYQQLLLSSLECVYTLCFLPHQMAPPSWKGLNWGIITEEGEGHGQTILSIRTKPLYCRHNETALIKELLLCTSGTQLMMYPCVYYIGISLSHLCNVVIAKLTPQTFALSLNYTRILESRKQKPGTSYTVVYEPFFQRCWNYNDNMYYITLKTIA